MPTDRLDWLEANVQIVGLADGWRVHLHFDDGLVTVQKRPPFASAVAAEDALERWIIDKLIGRVFGH